MVEKVYMTQFFKFVNGCPGWYSSVGWSSVPCTTRLQVHFTVAVCIGGNQPMFLSLSLSLKATQKCSQVRIKKKKNAVSIEDYNAQHSILYIEIVFPAISLLRLYPKNPETPIQKNLCIPMFIAALFTIANCWKQPKCPSANKLIQKL